MYSDGGSIQYFAAAAGIVGTGAVIGYVRNIWDEWSRKQELDKQNEHFDKILPFKYAYPTSKDGEIERVQVDHVGEVVKRLRASYDAGITKSYEWRMEQLTQLKKMLAENRNEIIKAVQKDLGKKHHQEVLFSEVILPETELDHTMKHLKSWMEPERVRSTLASIPASSWIYKDPLGTVLIISPWNYPVNLALVPLIGAIAGGNTVFLKLSRHSTHTGRTLEALITKYLDKRCIVAETDGGQAMITRLCEEHWDHIFFTGSVNVGKVVYQAAAKYLTPVTLELGGKNPCIVDKDVDIHLAAKRIAWGKFFNCGQTCITADYILVHKDVEQQLIEGLKKAITKFYGQNPKESCCYPRIISKQATQRLAGLFKHGEVVFGGEADENDNYIAPTIMRNVDLNSPLMTDEIFGPIIPLITVSSVDEAINFINKRPHPLALYYFGKNKANQEKVIHETRSGACLCNELLLHFTNARLPFGGVGDSGIGAYHGKLTFEVFTHRKAVIKSTSTSWLDIPHRYPPFNDTLTWVLDKVLKSGW